MRKILIIFIILAVGGYFALKHVMKTNLAVNNRVNNIIDRAAGLTAPVIDAFNNIKKAGIEKIDTLKNGISKETASVASKDTGKTVAIYLKHGNVINGTLLRQTKDEYVVDLKGEEFVIRASQVSRIEHKTQKDIEWPYKNDIVVKKKSGIVCDGKITKVDNEEVTLAFDEGGGSMEMGIPCKDIEYLIFAPVCNKETEETERNLKKLFPKMTMSKEGNITIFTDSYVKKAAVFKKILRSGYTETYLKFFPLFKDRKPLFQNFVVVFDDPVTYVESTGAPPYYLGFFDPTERILYLYDEFGDRIETMVFEMITGATGVVDKETADFKKVLDIDKRYDDFIDGQVKEFKDRFWKTFNLYKGTYTEKTRLVLRHELTHELFHNWGLQSVIISRPKLNKEKLIEKKKEFIETKDWEKKRKLLDEMMKMEKPKEIDMVVAQSWLAEGLATYCATEPIGSIDNELLFSFQDAMAKNKLNPIEFFTNFEKGSFNGIMPEAVYNSYAQSWLFTNFLMTKYQDQFIEYQKKMAESATAGQDNLAILLKLLNKDLPTLENEFLEYAKTYPKADDPFVKRYMENYEIWADLLSSHF